MADNVKGITIQIGGDVQPLNQALEEASKLTGKYGKQLVELNEKLKLNPNNVEVLTQKQKVLGEAIEESRKMVQDFRIAYDQALNGREAGTVTQEEVEAVKRGLDNAEAGLANYEQELAATNDALDRLSAGSETTGQSLEETGERASDTGEHFATMGDEAENAGDDLKKMAEDAEDAEDAMDGLEKAAGGLVKQFLIMAGLTGTIAKLGNEAAELIDSGKIDFLGNSYSDLKKRIDDTLASSKELRESYRKGKKDTENNGVLIEIQAKNVEKLNTQLKLENEANVTNTTTRQRLQQQVDLLNASLGETYITLNKETGEMEQSAAALQKKTEATKAYTLMQYELKSMQDLWIQEYELQQELAEINEQIESGHRGIGTSLEYKRHQIELELEAIQEETASAEENYNQQAEAYQSYAETYDTESNAIIEKMEERKKKSKEINKQIYDDQVSYNAKRVKDSQDTENKIKANTSISLGERIQNMKDNQKAIEDYEKNIQILLDHAYSIQDEHERERWLLTIQSLQDRNEVTMGTAQQLVEQLDNLGDDGAQAYVDAFNNGFKEGHIDRVFTDAFGRIVTLSTQYGDRIKKNLTLTFNASGQVTGTNRGTVKVTAFAQGGIVTKPTNALIGEAGPEAVIPLDKLGDIIRSALSDNRPTGGTYNMNIYPQSMSAGEQDALFNRFDKWLGGRTSRERI